MKKDEFLGVLSLHPNIYYEKLLNKNNNKFVVKKILLKMFLETKCGGRENLEIDNERWKHEMWGN